MKKIDKAKCLALCTIFLLSGLVMAKGGDAGYIFGKITMENGSTYQGVIRWEDEEAFWNDMFNSTKVEDVFDRFYSELKNIDDVEDEYFSQRDRRKRRSRGWGFILNIYDDDSDLSRQFKCRFGDIKEMRLRGRDTVILTFKNGETMELEGGSNDIGADILVYDDEFGDMEVRWRRIDKIEFMPAPGKLEGKFGEPLYGEVETRRGTFEGFIQWDHDECLSTDELDGESDDGDVEIPFGKIRSIEKYRRGSLVTMKSGRELYLTGSNDVDDDNRGIVIKNDEYGKVLVGWRDFDKITFVEKPGSSGPAYDDFPTPKWISGEVRLTNGENLKGRLIFDMDEALDLEILDGEDGDTEYMIPFRNIRKIMPERRYGSIVVLKSGKELELENSHDVDEDNDGILVWVGKNEAEYVLWRKIEEIVLD